MKCPECGNPEAEIKPQKKEGLVYRWCPECNAQYFARTPEASDRLVQKIGKAPVTVTIPEKPAAPSAPAKPAAPAAPKKPTYLEIMGVA
jgi:hypothetical protein